MQNDPQAELASLACGDHGIQGQFDLDGIFEISDLEAPNQATNVCVDGQPWQPEGNTAYDIGRLSTDAGKRDEILHGPGNLPVKVIDQPGRHSHQTLGFVSKETDGVDERFHLVL